MPEFLNTKLASQFLGITENALRIKVCRGLVPYFKFGRQLRFRYSELRSFLLRKDV
ncbi:MAG: helix-turn-helix domain-containing protein [Bdellovibrionaceae bacterium]|nr:helix-turn-helix domain-containing protein [Pseudobdellovibrionaceae bacterium]